MRGIHLGQGIATPLRDRLYARIDYVFQISGLATGEESLYAMTVLRNFRRIVSAKRLLRSARNDKLSAVQFQQA